MELKTPRDFRGLGGTVDDYIKRITEMDYGFYKITNDQKEIFTIIEGMYFIQSHFNKGVRLRGFNTKERKVEIYDLHKEQEKIDNSLEDFSI